MTQFHAGQSWRQGARDVTKCSVKTCSSSLHAAGPKVSPHGSAAGSRGPTPANKETKSGPEREPGGEHSAALRACALCVDILVRSNAFQAQAIQKLYFLVVL